MNPLNLFLRFILELIALVVIGIFAWEISEGYFKYILALGLPLIFAGIWGVFAVPNDPSRSGQTVVVTKGYIRLLIELVIFAFATGAIYVLDYKGLSLLFGIIVILHYIFSYERVFWLLKQ